MKKVKVKKGRPKVIDPVKSYTVSLKISDKNLLIKKYSTLTNAIKNLL